MRGPLVIWHLSSSICSLWTSPTPPHTSYSFPTPPNCLFAPKLWFSLIGFGLVWPIEAGHWYFSCFSLPAMKSWEQFNTANQWLHSVSAETNLQNSSEISYEMKISTKWSRAGQRWPNYQGRARKRHQKVNMSSAENTHQCWKRRCNWHSLTIWLSITRANTCNPIFHWMMKPSNT